MSSTTKDVCRIDEKWRIFFPEKRLRKKLGKEVTILLDPNRKCLLVFRQRQLKFFLDELLRNQKNKDLFTEIVNHGERERIKEGKLRIPLKMRDCFTKGEKLIIIESEEGYMEIKRQEEN